MAARHTQAPAPPRPSAQICEEAFCKGGSLVPERPEGDDGGCGHPHARSGGPRWAGSVCCPRQARAWVALLLGRQAEPPLRGPVGTAISLHESGNMATEDNQLPQPGPDAPGHLPAGLTWLHQCLLLTGPSPRPPGGAQGCGGAGHELLTSRILTAASCPRFVMPPSDTAAFFTGRSCCKQTREREGGNVPVEGRRLCCLHNTTERA